MRKLTCICTIGVFLGACVVANAQDEKTAQLCDPAATPEICVPDTIEITFDGDSQSILEYTDFASEIEGQDIDMTVMTDTKTEKVQGWSYGVAHDLAAVTISEANITGTDAEALLDFGFDATSAEDIEKCGVGDDACEPANRTQGGGFISAVVLSFTKPIELPIARNSIAKAKYQVTVDVGTDGTVIEVSDQLAKKNSPPTDVNVTIEGKSRKWETAVNGWIKEEGGCEPTEPDMEVTCDDGLDNDCDGLIDGDDPDCEVCELTEPDMEVTCDDGLDNDCDGLIDGDDPDCEVCEPTEPDQEITCDDGLDNDCDGLIDLDDPDCDVGPCDAPDYALYFGPNATDQDVDIGAGTEYVVTCRNALNALGFQLGVSSDTAGGTTTWEFSESLGVDADRLIELIITDEDGNSQTPETPNKATSDEESVDEIQRGAAIAAFEGDDFYAFDLTPGVGGPGYTVGYVADLNPPQGGGNEIPATGNDSPCPTNEILVVRLGVGPGVQFSRGDADANGKINVSDAILIIQIVVGNLQERFDCDKALDADDSGDLSVLDAIPVLNYVFDLNGGDPLPDPFKVCGDDPTADSLTCVETNCQ